MLTRVLNGVRVYSAGIVRENDMSIVADGPFRLNLNIEVVEVKQLYTIAVLFLFPILVAEVCRVRVDIWRFHRQNYFAERQEPTARGSTQNSDRRFDPPYQNFFMPIRAGHDISPQCLITIHF